MAFLRKLLSVAAFAAALVVQAAPVSPDFKMEFVIDGDQGKMVGTVTAPSTGGAGWWDASPLPEGSLIDLKITRTCYALGEDKLPVAEFLQVPMGELRTFVDEVPWAYGNTYAYYATATLNGESSYESSVSKKPGIEFYLDSAKATSIQKEDGSYEVKIEVVPPTKDNSDNDLPMEMTKMEFYRITDNSAWPPVMELMDIVDNPVKGEVCTYVDENPTLNVTNYYQVKCISPFGFCESQVYEFVGLDVPGMPSNVKAEYYGDGVKVTWVAPTTGKNHGKIDLEDTSYDVYRCWGRGNDERVKIAESIKETEFIDYATDMEVPRGVNYEVLAKNSQGNGGSASSTYYQYNMVVGPPEKLPFVETFDNVNDYATDHLWTMEASNYYCGFMVSAYFYNGNETLNLQPYSGEGAIYADFAWGNGTSDLTSYNIKVEGSNCLGLSFAYYTFPGEDITISVDLSKDGGEFETIREFSINEGTESEWKRVFVAFEGLEETKNVKVRLHVSAPVSKKVAILDEIKLIDYPSVGAIGVEYDQEACTATLTWEDPSTEYATVERFEGFVDGVSVGDVVSPWVYEAPEYRTTYSLAVKAVYADIEAPLSAPVSVSVPRPPYTEFTIDDHIFSILTTAPEVHEVVVKQYLGKAELYKFPEMVTYDEVSYEVVGVGTEAYKGNTNIVSVSLPDRVREVGAGAFMDCTSLSAVSFGTGLTAIKDAAFKGCTSLASVIFTSETVPEVALDAFEGINDACKGKCPKGTEEEYDAVEGLDPIDFGVYYTEFTTDDHIFSILTTAPEVHEVVVKEYLGKAELYKIPETVTYGKVTYDVVGIGTEAYKGNTDIVSVSLSDLVKEVGTGAFMDCTSISSVSFGTGLTAIKDAAFKGCTSLANVVFTSETVPEVALDAFEGIKEGCKGECPEGTEEEYDAVEGLDPLDFGVLGIADILAYPEGDVKWFDLQGRPVAKPVPGQILIATTPAGTVRVVVK